MVAQNSFWQLVRSSAWLAAALLVAAVGCGPATPNKPADPNKPGPTPATGDPKPSGPVKRIVFVTNGNSPYWDACRVGLQEGDKAFDLKGAGLTAIMEVNDGTPAGQIEKLRQYATQDDIAGVALSALDADNAQVATEMKNLAAKGIKVICVDADVNREKYRDARLFYIGTDNVSGGRVLGTAGRQLLLARKKDKGSYAQFVGRTGSHNAIERMGGFQKSVGEEFKEADRMGDDLDLTRARDNVRNAITNHPDLVALVGIWSYNAPAIVDVVKEKGVRDQFTIVTFDAEPIALKQMAAGQIDAMVVQDPYNMGFQTCRLMKAIVANDDKTIAEMYPNKGKPEGDLYDTGLKIVVPAADTPLKKEQFSEFGDKLQFMTLTDFQAWLTKYNLTGS